MFAHSKEKQEMNNDERGGNKGYRNVRAVLHIGMGGIYLLFGTIIIMYHNFGSMDLSPTLAYSIGGLMLLYGIFRLYRGLADMREMRRERKNRL